eukprot:TRINITY_DN17701_c0_g1_i1.p1 TRINITY_DN17701_c0_g1~~TRINITY_DN17701_c0_g1_i1.p1  ORF type:complete len:181 (+),score=31.63 TRINITY_DN17701_c0_g1_i1:73-615(+)
MREDLITGSHGGFLSMPTLHDCPRRPSSSFFAQGPGQFPFSPSYEYQAWAQEAAEASRIALSSKRKAQHAAQEAARNNLFAQSAEEDAKSALENIRVAQREASLQLQNLSNAASSRNCHKHRRRSLQHSSSGRVLASTFGMPLCLPLSGVPPVICSKSNDHLAQPSDGVSFVQKRWKSFL